MVYPWVWNLAKNWYRDSQIFEVRQAHPHTILVKVTPPPSYALYSPYCGHTGGVSHWHGIRMYVPAFGVLIREIWYSYRWVFIRDEEPKLHKLGVFWANSCKSRGPLEWQKGVSGSSMDSQKAPKHVFLILKFVSLNKYSSGIWHPKQVFFFSKNPKQDK